jgi:Ser/Thr protein kinase RdoA (MazF antagonist)
VISLDALRAVLRREWGLASVDVVAHHGGMNSATWWVEVDGVRRFVVKSVPNANRDNFRAGLAVAGIVEAGGIPAGGAVPARAGPVVSLPDGSPVALLRYVEGDELTVDDADAVGATLGRVHRILAAARVDGEHPLHRVDPDAPYIAVRDWIRPAVTAALRDIDTGGMTHGLLHTDPAPEAFRRDRATGAVGLIDWSVACRGPLMYDLASAVMYVGGPEHRGPLAEAYLATGALTAAEVDRALWPMLRYRAAVQAMYFAWRTYHDDLTGIAGAHENDQGLDDAKAMLAAWT